MILQGVLARRVARGSGLEGLAFPLSGLLAGSGCLPYSAFLALRRGGILLARDLLFPARRPHAGLCAPRATTPASRAVGWPAA